MNKKRRKKITIKKQKQKNTKGLLPGRWKDLTTVSMEKKQAVL